MDRNRKPTASRFALAALVTVGLLASGMTPASAEKKHPLPPKGRGNDRTPPSLVCPGDMTVDATAPIGAYVEYTVLVDDDKDPFPTVTFSHPSRSTFPVGTTTVTVTATDWKENTSTCTFDVTVNPPTGTFEYEMLWWSYDYEYNSVAWYVWAISVDTDGTILWGSGEQDYLLEEYPEYMEEYAVPMPDGLTGSGSVSGSIGPGGTSTIDLSYDYWVWTSGDVDEVGERIYSKWSGSFSGEVQTSVDAAGNLHFTGPYYAVWTPKVR